MVATLPASASQTRPAAGQQMDFLSWLFRPLLKVDEARYLLADPSADTVIRRLDDGSLRAVDISALGAESGRRELRIYRYSVEWIYTPGTQGKPLPMFSPAEILPHTRDVIRRDDVAKLLNCDPKHVANLPLGKSRLARAASAASADRTPLVARAALVEFLLNREVRP